MPTIPILTCTPVMLLFCASIAAAPNPPALHIEVRDAQDARVAGPVDRPSSSKHASAVLNFDRDYRPGDRILISGPRRLAVRLDEAISECLLYLPEASANTYEVPYGREEKETGSAHDPASFAGKSHRISLRVVSKGERGGYRNLALNPCDWQPPDPMAPQFFPHATTNSVSRDLFDFAARNAIDGITQNGHHGVWPYQSWGPQLRTDLWWKVDFGRPVDLDKLRLMVRADFPHDSYWKTADIEFSDGSHVSIQISSSPEFQDFHFSKRSVTWLRLNKLVPDDEKRWCAFIEVEAWGHDLP